MIWFLWISIGALVFFDIVLTIQLTVGFGHTRAGDRRWPTITAGATAGLVLFVCGVITIGVLSSRSVGKITCRNWGKNTGYKTKFVIQNWADGGTCLTLTTNGRWVKNTQIIINVPEEKK